MMLHDIRNYIQQKKKLVTTDLKTEQHCSVF